MDDRNWTAMKNVRAPVDMGLGGYVCIGVGVTGVQDALYPWNLADVLEIRRMIGDDFIPVTRRIVYRTPSWGRQTYVHLGVAMRVSNAEPEPKFQGILMPSWAPWPRPNVMGFWFEPPKTQFEGINGLPAHTVAWGRWVVQMAEESKRLTAKEAKKKATEYRENSPEKRARVAAEEEARYAQREEAHRQKNLFGSMSSSEQKEFGQLMNGTLVEEHERKPFIYVSQG